MHRKNLPLLILIFINLIVAALLYIAFSALQIPTLFPCSFPQAKYLALSLIIMLAVDSFLGLKFLINGYIQNMVVFALMTFSVIWLGSYRFSPLGFSTGRISVLRGFVLTTPFRSNLKVISGGTVTLSSGSYAGIHPVTFPVGTLCTWLSAQSAALDDRQSCDTVYTAPGGVAFDLLKINIQSKCGLPEARGQIRVNILP